MDTPPIQPNLGQIDDQVTVPWRLATVVRKSSRMGDLKAEIGVRYIVMVGTRRMMSFTAKDTGEVVKMEFAIFINQDGIGGYMPISHFEIEGDF